MPRVAPFIGCGRLAESIPALTTVDPSRFGLALATVDGAVYGVGDWQIPFSIQSVSKVFSLALILSRDGESIWQRVGREPSGSPYNSLQQQTPPARTCWPALATSSIRSTLSSTNTPPSAQPP